MLRGESLTDLDAAPVPVHIAETTDVHQDIEAELLPGTERAQHFVVTTAMAES